MKGFDEFLGRKMIVEYHSDQSITGMCGIVIDETRETVLLSSSDGNKRIAKNNATFRFEDGVLDGNLLKYRPQDRIKKVKF